jgi:hypothetical protein
MTKLLIFNLILLSNIAFGQITASDTINYDTMLDKKSYWLVKVKSNKSKETVYRNQIVLFTWRVEKTEDIEPKWSKTLRIGDTLMWADWDYDKGFQPIRTHSCGKIALNKTTNLVTLEKYVWGVDKIFTRKFKVLKWTKSNIILLDISNISLKRIYSFE